MRDSERRGSAAATRQSWLRWAARVGYASCGIVYIATGAIAAAVVLGVADRPRGTHRALVLIERQPLGDFFLSALALGFLGYAALNLAGALRDPERRGTSLHGIAMRSADALTGAIYAALALAAVRIAADAASPGGGAAAAWLARVLAIPGGALILFTGGLGLLGAGGFLIYRARAERFDEVFDRRTLSPRTALLLARAARFGTVVRGVVLGISGVLVMEAAVTRRLDHVGGVGVALSTLETTPFGALLLAVAALGFIGYGAYQLGKVHHRRVSIG